ncbi:MULTISPECIES: GNAT family N-acetyltransferase [unclassified Agarivorans]|uniref:GNAT family N-acetyltransferase n=1 Tax=unclassified Agarivorans TaxID=2636026 RepID=UPI003D7DAC55
MAVLREMRAADYQAVMALWRQAEGMTLRDADSEQSIAAYLQRNPGLSFVAVAQQQLVGAVLAGTDGRRGYLQHLVVAKAYRSQGLGRQLVAQVVAAFKCQGIAKTHLFVHLDNLHAQQFYQSLNWFPRDEVRMFSFNASSNPEV